MTTRTSTQQPQGPDWLTLRPEHFDRDLLPRRYRNAPEGLFSVVEVLPEMPADTSTEPDMAGQLDLFGEN